MLKKTSVCSGDVLGLWATSGFAGASGVELGFFSFGSIRSASALHSLDIFIPAAWGGRVPLSSFSALYKNCNRLRKCSTTLFIK
jgi:hypothetical protein